MTHETLKTIPETIPLAVSAVDIYVICIYIPATSSGDSLYCKRRQWVIRVNKLKLVTVKSTPKNIFNEEIEVEQLSELPKEFKPLSNISETNSIE